MQTHIEDKHIQGISTLIEKSLLKRSKRGRSYLLVR